MILLLLGFAGAMLAFSKGDRATGALDTAGLLFAARLPPAAAAGNAISNRKAVG